MRATIADLLMQTVKKYPDREAMVDVKKNKRWTYTDFYSDVQRTAGAFANAGVQKGDRVSAVLMNTSELAVTLFACAYIGAVFNPINFRLKSDELAYIFKDASPKIIIFEKAAESQIRPLVSIIDPEIRYWCIDQETPDFAYNFHREVSLQSTAYKEQIQESDLSAIMYTSGTTGRPKGVMHRHTEMVEQSLICSEVLKLSPNDRGLVCAPMFHCAELHCSFLPRVLVGASNIILHEFNAEEVLKTIEQERITTFFSAPTMWNMLLQENHSRYQLTSLRIGLYGAAPMPPVLVENVKKQFRIQLVQAYGQTEMGPAVSFLLDEDQMTKAGSAGKACYRHEIRVVKIMEGKQSDPDETLPPFSVGEILVKGPCMMEGYYNKDEATMKALYKGWYHTGDLGYTDEDGYLYIADRADDMIISGGENIYPREVEDILYEHPAVLDAAVFGLPHDQWGEQVTAAVVKKENVTAEELELFCKSSTKLAGYKRPRRYLFVDALPRNASGKVQKYILREQLGLSSIDLQE